MASFAVQKLLSLNRSHLFIFISITLGDGLKKNIAVIYVSFLPLFSSSFILLTYI